MLGVQQQKRTANSGALHPSVAVPLPLKKRFKLNKEKSGIENEG